MITCSVCGHMSVSSRKTSEEFLSIFRAVLTEVMIFVEANYSDEGHLDLLSLVEFYRC